MEEWKTLEGFDNHQYGGYLISNYGRVKNGHGKILYLVVTKKGYNKVQLYSNCKKKSPFVHRLVAKTFIPNPENLPQVNHKDTNKANNHVDNLEWCTNKQNAHHALANNLMVIHRGDNHPSAKITLQKAKEIRSAVLHNNFRRRELAKKYGVSESVVKDIRSGRSWNYA